MTFGASFLVIVLVEAVFSTRDDLVSAIWLVIDETDFLALIVQVEEVDDAIEEGNEFTLALTLA